MSLRTEYLRLARAAAGVLAMVLFSVLVLADTFGFGEVDESIVNVVLGLVALLLGADLLVDNLPLEITVEGTGPETDADRSRDPRSRETEEVADGEGDGKD